MDGEAVAGKLTDTCEAEQKGQREALERSLTKDEEQMCIRDRNMNTLVDMISGMEVKEDDEDFMNAVDYMFCLLYTSGRQAQRRCH